MVNPVRRFARRLQRLPLWIKLPVIIMQVGALIILVGWLYLTRSIETVTIPNLNDQSLEVVRKKLYERNLNYRIIRRNSTQTPENHVIRQVPPSGKRIKETRQIEVYVSEGPELVEVPDLTGKSLFEARNRLYKTTAGKESNVGRILNLGNISRVFHSSTSQEKIFLQDPQPGRTVIRGTQVDLLVSKGPWPKRTIVPNLKGSEVAEAKNRLRKDSLKVGEIRYVLEQEKPRSVILRQSPASGQIVRRDRPVSLTVNLSEQAKVDPKKFTFVRVTPPLSADKGRLKVTLIDRRGSRVVYQDEVSPGKQVEFMVSIRGSAKLIIYWNGEIYQFRRLEYER